VTTERKQTQLVPRVAPARAPSSLGFGCASLGSRIGASHGLDALAAAYDAGVTWFDVAPAYGAGEAEALLAEFLQGRRSRVSVTTKVGIAPPERLRMLKMAYALGRPLLGVAAGLRRGFRAMSATRNRRVPLNAELISRSIECSLRRLRTGHVDVFALHDPDPADVVNDEIRRTLERVLERGQARAIAVAGTLDACMAANVAGAPYSVLQMSAETLASARSQSAACGQRLVTHSVFGVNGGMHERLVAAIMRRPDKARWLVSAGYDARIEQAAADLLLDSALAFNPNGVVVTSMFHPRHRAANLARAARPLSGSAPGLVRELLA
jgi:Aldo/keto reductase family